MDKIRLGSDNDLNFKNFTNKRTGAILTAATVTAELFDNAVAAGPRLGALITLAEDGATGDYYGKVANDHVGLVDGMEVRVEITGNGGSGLLQKEPFLAHVESVK